MNDFKPLLDECVQLLSDTIKWEEDATYAAHRLGLQGEKRRNRLASAENSNLLKHIRCIAYDITGKELTPYTSTVSMHPTSDFESYFSAYHRKLDSMYTSMHDLANRMVLAHAQPIAKILYDKIACILKEIIEVRRTINECSAAGWSAHWVMLAQTSALNVHDDFEKKEASVGYHY